MRVATVSCRENEFPIERGQLHNVNDLAGSWCFGSRIHFPLKESTGVLKDYDAVWFTMSKQIREYEGNWMDLLSGFKARWPEKKVILHQEGECEFFLNRRGTEWKIQKGWITTLQSKVDLLLTHNAREASLYRYLMDKGEVEAWRTVQDVEKIKSYVISPEKKTKKRVGISTYDGRAGGIVGMAVASKITEEVVQVTRSIYKDNREEVICDRFGVWPEVTPQCGWYEWLDSIHDLYLYLHPMPAASAGRDTIACAALGIPVIGNKYLDAQMHLFPELAVDVYDARRMEQLVTELLYDRDFYERVRKTAMDRVGFYNIEYGVDRAEKTLQRLDWK